MGIENFKRWHWALIGLVAGLVMAYMRTSMVTPDETSTYRRGISAFEFTTDINRPKTGNGFPWLSNIVVYPPVENKNYVTARMLEIQPDGRGIYRAVQMNTDIPFRVARFSDPKSATYSIREYLTDAQQKNADLKFTFAWWALPAAQYILWVGGGLVILGGLWPMAINLMIGAGLGRKKGPEEAYDLERFGKTPEPVAPSGRPVVTAEALGQLQDYQESLERNLAGAGMAITTDAPAVAGSTTGASEIKTLSAGPAEAAAAPVGANDEPKDFKGEYYPVAKAAKPKDSD